MWGKLAKVSGGAQRDRVLAFDNFKHGLNTFEPADRIAKTEASELINWMIVKGGRLVSRPVLLAHSTVATTSNSPVRTIAHVVIGGTAYTLLVDDNYILYYLDANLAPQAIGTLEGPATILTYNGVAVILDGSYVKYLDGVSAIKIAYDAGTGLSGYQFDNTALTQNATLALGNATITKVGHEFTTQAWDDGYTIPITSFSVYISKTGTPTGDITVKLFDSATDTEHASKVLCDASAASVTASEFTIYFTASDITTQMSLSTNYYISLEYSGGDAGNYISVACNTVASGGKSKYYAAAAWTGDDTKDVVCSIGPGKPPKGKFGATWKNRIFVAGDPDNKGWVWFGNLTHLDWSTPDGGGNIGVVDASASSFEVGALCPMYGNLFILGTQAQPYMVQLSGEDPTDFVQSMLFQKTWSTHKTLQSAVNDLWFANAEGAGYAAGVQEFGDLRTFFASDPVFDRLKSYWDTSTALAGYYPPDSQYWLVMPSYHRVLVCHTKNGVTAPDREGLRYPWTEYEFYRENLSASTYKWTASASGTNEYYLTLSTGATPAFAKQPDFVTLDGKKITSGTIGALSDHQWGYGDNDSLGFNTVYIRDESGDPDTTGAQVRTVLIPTSMAEAGSNFLIGCSDGFVRKISTSDYKDHSIIQILPIVQTAYIELPFAHAQFTKVQLMASAKGGGRMTVRFYTNGRFLSQAASETVTMNIRDDLTVSDLTMDVEDMIYPVDGSVIIPLFSYVNFNARMIMARMDSVTIAGYPIYNNGLLLKYRGQSI